MIGKRIFFTLLSTSLLFGAVSCSCSKKKPKPSEEESESELIDSEQIESEKISESEETEQETNFIINSSISIDDENDTFTCFYSDIPYIFGFNSLSTSNNRLVISSNGYLENITPIHGLEEVLINGTGSYKISYGYEQGIYDFVSKTFNGNHKYLFNNDSPSFFKIEFLDDGDISSIIIKFSSIKNDNPFKKIPSYGEISINGHEYQEKETVDFPSFPVSEGLSYHLSDDGTYYIVDNYYDQLVVDSYHRIVFPSEFNGLPVKQIGYHGFIERLWIYEIYIPESITMIENECFSMCGLKKVYWDAINCNDFPARNGIFHPSDVQNIDLIIGPHVKHIPARLMLPSLMTPNIHSNVKSISFAHNSIVESIGDYAFYGQSKLNRIDIPDTVKTIGDSSFYGWGLEELKLDNVTSIGNNAFRFNEKLEHVSLPNCLNNIGESVFEGCSSLKEIDIENTQIEVIPFAAFKNCTSLEHIRLPLNLLSIGDSAFEGCNKLLELILPESNIELGNRSFYNCVELTFIELNKNLRRVQNEAFYGCINLSTLVIRSKSIDDLKLNNKVFLLCGENGLDIYISGEVDRIPNNMFYGTSLVECLPNIINLYFYKITEVGDNAFFGQINTNVFYYGYNSDISNFEIGLNNDILNNIQAREE